MKYLKYFEGLNISDNESSSDVFTDEEISELKEVVSYWTDEFDFEIVSYISDRMIGVFYYYHIPVTQFGLKQDEIEIEFAFIGNYKGEYLEVVDRIDELINLIENLGYKVEFMKEYSSMILRILK